MNKQTLLGGLLGLLLLAVFGWYALHNKAIPAAPEEGGAAATSTDSGNTVSILNPDGFITKATAQKVDVPAPSLDRAVPKSDLDASVAKQFIDGMNATIANLKKNPESFQDWIDLGLDRKQLRDYEGAAQAWEYVSLLYPTNSVSFPNLGDLYTNFLPDYARAEKDYLTAIKNKPTDSYLYSNLYDLYQLYKSGAGNGITILKQGIAANPKALELQVLLARAYRDVGDIGEASAAYDTAIKTATGAGETNAADSLKAEKAALSN